MRRIATMLLLLVATAGTVVASAGADDKKSYQAEFFNAFGIVEGSELRIAGVKAGTITDLDITPQKTALVSFEVDPGFPELKADATCSSEPQSLIAEYFVDCQPGSSDEPLEGPIPAAKNQTTVQNDLVNNTLREPFKRRFQLIINEFGTALVGNPENLNAAIRAGAPALREFRKVLKILGRQNQLIAQLNADSDQIIGEMTERREDVVSFIDEAEDTARISAQRRSDLSRDFDLLDDFLFELKPVMFQLGNLAREQTPLLTDLYHAAPGLNKLATNLPRFNNGTRISLKSLGRAGQVGTRTFKKADDEIAELNQASKKAFPAADIVADFLQSIDSPRNAVEEDCDAREDLRELPGEADRRVRVLEAKLGTNLTGDKTCLEDAPAGSETGNPGYTGLEGLLNYAYVQTLSLNMFDELGHALHFMIVGALDASEGDGECGHYSAGPDYGAKGGGRTTDPRNALQCVVALGDKQPDINFDLNLPRYDNSVCPDGSEQLALCDPSISTDTANAKSGIRPTSGGGDLDEEQKKERLELEKELRDILDLPPGAKLPPKLEDGLGLGQSDQAAADDLLGFLFK